MVRPEMLRIISDSTLFLLPMRILATVCFLCLISACSEVTTADIVARSHTWAGSVSIERDGEEWSEGCSLTLIAHFQQITHRISLKRPYVNCSLFGPVQIVLSEAPDHSEVLVFVEAARGGDGDHSGPILEVFHLGKSAIRKIGEAELFSANYVRKDQQIDSITGRILFTFCTVCDGPEAADPEDNIFVPVRIRIRENSLETDLTATDVERTALWRQFQTRKQAALEEYGEPEYIASLEKQLAALLRIR